MNKYRKMRSWVILAISVFGSFGSIRAQQQGNVVTALQKHDQAVHVLQEDIANPFVEMGSDGYYYLTGTVPMDLSSSKESFVKIWRSKDLATWESFGEIKHAQGSEFVKELWDFAGKRNITPDIRSSEAHYVNNRWVIVHTSNVRVANLMLSASSDIKGPYTEPLGLDIGFHVDPSIFVDDDGTPWLLSNCTQIRKIKKDFSGFDGNHRLIGPKSKQLGFEGTRMVKVGGKYVLFGTSWSTDVEGKGTYNLYYATADRILGPYTPRKFAGRFIGNGAPFKDKDGRWWALAFHRADHPPLQIGQANSMDLSGAAYTINKKGLTLVPLDVLEENGEIKVISKDPAYRYPGKEEVQQFGLD